MWQTPKTNWLGGDYFYHNDYNRITGNIDYIRDMLGYPSMFTPKYNSGYMRVSEYNAITREIQRIYDLGDYGFYYAGVPDRTASSPPWNVTHLNTIESGINLIYLSLIGEISQITDESKEDNLVSEDTNYNIYSE